MFNIILNNVNRNIPLVHLITNYVTVNDCANIILAAGGSEVMANNIDEVAEITAGCSSLVINTGALNNFTLEAMLKAGIEASKRGHPIILDPVGVGASKLRTETVLRLIEELDISVIKGNASEMKYLTTGRGNIRVADASAKDMVTEDNIEMVVKYCREYSKKTGAVISVSGAIDIIADKDNAYAVYNGHPLMTKVTGTGCMLTALIACYAGGNPGNLTDATLTAFCTMGISGEIAYEKMYENDGGTSSYKMYLLDSISKINPLVLERYAKIQKK